VRAAATATYVSYTTLNSAKSAVLGNQMVAFNIHNVVHAQTLPGPKSRDHDVLQSDFPTMHIMLLFSLGNQWTTRRFDGGVKSRGFLDKKSHVLLHFYS
jgi:hypothetical protein